MRVTMDTPAMFLVLAVLVQPGSVWSYSSGAPSSQCTSMVPGHGSQQAGASPFRIDTGSTTSYTPNQAISVRLVADSGSFKGILLQARLAGTTTIVGTFSNLPSGIRGLDCVNSGDTITHSSSATKSDISLTWTAPDTDRGDIELTATFVQVKSSWWKNVKLTLVAPSNIETTSVTTTSTNAPTTSQPESQQNPDTTKSPAGVATTTSGITQAPTGGATAGSDVTAAPSGEATVSSGVTQPSQGYMSTVNSGIMILVVMIMLTMLG